MNVLMTEENRFTGITENLYHDYETVKALYPYDFNRSEHWNDRIDWLDANPGADRARVSEALMALNRGLGAQEKTLDNIRILIEKQCLTIVTGQQTGLFTGPLYTLYKAVTTIKQAQSLRVKTGRPVVPVFWMATEDHDYAEIAMNWHFDGHRAKRIRLSREHRSNMPVGTLPVTEELVRLCEELCADLDLQKNGQEMATLLRSTLTASTNLGEWFGRLLLDLFAPWGLVVLDPSAPAMRAVMAPFFEKSLLETQAIQQAFQQGTLAVSARGFNPEVTMGEGQTGVFLIDEGVRIPLYTDAAGTHFSDRHGQKQWSLEALMTRIKTHPENFSTGVVLRPVLQDWLLPVVSAVLGPSEAAYHGQLGAVFAIFDRRLPVIVPRESWALAPDSDFLDAGEIKELLTASPDDWFSDQIMRLADDKLKGRIDQHHDSYLERLGLLIDSLPVSRDARELLTDRASKMQEQEKKWMLKQIRKSLIAEAGAATEYHTFVRMMRPLGKQQERTLLPWYFLSRFGRNLLNDLVTMEFSTYLRIYKKGETS